MPWDHPVFTLYSCYIPLQAALDFCQWSQKPFPLKAHSIPISHTLEAPSLPSPSDWWFSRKTSMLRKEFRPTMSSFVFWLHSWCSWIFSAMPPYRDIFISLPSPFSSLPLLEVSLRARTVFMLILVLLFFTCVSDSAWSHLGLSW